MAAEARAPSMVDRYAIYEEFAAGGMATVHFARLIGPQGFRRTVAVKRLLPHLLHDREFTRMLLDEARLTGRVRHPNVVSTLDVVQTESELLLVMEYVHGESLATLARTAKARGEAIPIAISVALIIDVLHGLHAAHEAKDERGAPLGIVHRDVSPQNILVSAEGVARIADFGIAKAAGLRESTESGVLKGKLLYMAPEQVQAGSISRATDVYAAAIVLWELLTGVRLFEGKNQAERLFRLLVAPVAAPSAHNAALSPELDAVVMRGLARDPADRYPSAREMALALEAHAPPIRPSEVAGWVERIGGEPLAQRARLLATIEQDRAPEADARSSEQADPPPHVAAEPAPSAPAASGTTDLASALATSADEERHPARARRRLPLVALALASAATAAALMTWRGLGDPEPADAASTSAALDTREAAHHAAPRTPSHAVAQHASMGADHAPAPPVAATPVPLAEERDAATPTAPDATGASPEQAQSRKPRRHAPSPRRARPAERCDPPYSIDAAGRILFKVECM